VELRKNGKIRDVLLLLEHDPVITLGRNADRSHVIASPETLSERRVEVFECDRGGDVTFHGRGQLVAYPVFDLRGTASETGARRTIGAVEYVRRLEEVLVRTCADFGIPTRRVPGLTGVWTASPSHQEAKIAAIGVHISRAVTSHGFSLNVNTDLDYFHLIVPCGIAAKPVTSMAKELGRPLSLQDVAHSISRNFGVVFQSQMLWLEDLQSLLGTSVGVPMKVPSELRHIHKEEDTFWA
jgi:lipoyl(octanoyl) transferase